MCSSVHVRRSDKIGVEAAYHGIEEYMVHVSIIHLATNICGCTGTGLY